MVKPYGLLYEATTGFKRIKAPHPGTGGVKTTGIFIEEAFAAEVEAQWREEDESGYKEHGQNIVAPGSNAPIPLRFIDLEKGIDYIGGQQASIMVPGYAGYGLQIIRKALLERGDTDIFQLLIESRQPQHEVKAKRQIAKSIDSLSPAGMKPGLYRRLMDIPYPYSEQQILNGLKLIQSAVQTSKP